MTSMQDVPLEVWQEIASFLDSKEICQLYSVNRTLYNIAMDERYRVCKIGSLHHDNTKKMLTRLRDVEIAQRVRKVILATDDLFRYIQMEQNAQAGPVPDASLVATFSKLHISIDKNKGKKNTRLMGGPPKPRVKAMQAYHDILHIMSLLTSVVELEIFERTNDYRFFKELNLSSPPLTCGWKAFGEALRSLDIYAPVETLTYFLPLVSDTQIEPILPGLEKFYLDIYRTSLTTDMASVLTSTVLPFLRSQRHTIVKLVFHIRDQIDVGTFLTGVDTLPNLRSFEFTQMVRGVQEAAADFDGLKRFIQAHSKQLTSLRLVANSPVEDFQATPPSDIIFSDSEWTTISLPTLQSLVVDLFPAGTNHGLIAFVHRFAKTLVSLKIHQHFFIDGDLEILLKRFRAGSPLRDLRIAVKSFTPSILTTFASNIPQLQQLQLQFGTIEGSVNQHVGSLDSFTEELKELSFPKFRLRHLMFEDTYNLGGEFYSRQQALFTALPNLETLSGRSREEFLPVPQVSSQPS